MIALISGVPSLRVPVRAVTLTTEVIGEPELVMNDLAPLTVQMPSPEPPTAVGIIEVVNADGSAGPRIHMQVCETSPKDIAIDMPVQFTFRCIHRVGLRPNYFWKSTPVVAAAQGASV